MVHPATRRAALEAVNALGVGVDIGFIFPPKDDASRGRGVWTGRDLGARDVSGMLDRAAAANAAGVAIYLRLGPFARTAHPGIILLDDLNKTSLDALREERFHPCLVVETSPKNFQAWIRLTKNESVPYEAVHRAVRTLASRFDADPRAVSPMQPGRLPGFTNRKPKHKRPNGQYPFVRLVYAEQGRIAENGPDVLSTVMKRSGAQGRDPRPALPETPRLRGDDHTESETFQQLDTFRDEARKRFQEERSRKKRPSSSCSDSELDFAVAVRALSGSSTHDSIAAWLRCRRPEKSEDYAMRTVRAAMRYLEQKTSFSSGATR